MVSDPHVTDFFGHKFQVHEPGTYTVLKKAGINVQVTIDRCGGSSQYKSPTTGQPMGCNAEVAIKTASCTVVMALDKNYCNPQSYINGRATSSGNKQLGSGWVSVQAPNKFVVQTQEFTFQVTGNKAFTGNYLDLVVTAKGSQMGLVPGVCSGGSTGHRTCSGCRGQSQQGPVCGCANHRVSDAESIGMRIKRVSKGVSSGQLPRFAPQPVSPFRGGQVPVFRPPVGFRPSTQQFGHRVQPAPAFPSTQLFGRTPVFHRPVASTFGHRGVRFRQQEELQVRQAMKTESYVSAHQTCEDWLDALKPETKLGMDIFQARVDECAFDRVAGFSDDKQGLAKVFCEIIEDSITDETSAEGLCNTAARCKDKNLIEGTSSGFQLCPAR